MRKKYKNHCHTFNKITKDPIIQEHFIFYDTESNKTIDENGTQTHTLDFGYAQFWDKTSTKKYENPYFFETYQEFWDYVISKFSDNIKNIIIYSHNESFDIRMVNGLTYLTQNGWIIETVFLKTKQFFINLKKEGEYLKIWDTLNYANSSLADMGEDVNYPKLKINLDMATREEKKIYCQRDVKIVHEWIKKFCLLLESNQLSILKPTITGISRESFQRKFLDPNIKIQIHSMTKAIELERSGFGGGISDVFQTGDYGSKKLYFLDINSSYPNELYHHPMPIKLLRHTDDKLMNKKDIRNLFNNYIDNPKYGVIANVDIELPQKWAYVLVKSSVDNINKSMFLSGRFNSTFCEPELKYIIEHGKILNVKEINIYQMENIYKEFVEFFYGMKKQASIDGNKSLRTMSKLILNSAYGFWSTKNYGLKQIGTAKDNKVKKYTEKNYKEGEKVVTSQIVQLGYQIFEMQTNNQENARESLVSISAWVTSLARISLINYILLCGGRKHIWYADTDSLITDLYGYQKLLQAKVVNPYRLGALNLEHIISNVKIYRPKFYQYDYFDKKLNKNFTKKVCKGMNKDADIIYETDKQLFIENEQWETINSALKNGNTNVQIISKLEKVFSKIYDGGNVDKNGYVTPYHVNENIISVDNPKDKINRVEYKKQAKKPKLFDVIRKKEKIAYKKAYAKKYTLKHRKEKKEYDKKYQKDNKVKIKKYKQDNKKKIKKYQKEYREKTKIKRR